MRRHVGGFWFNLEIVYHVLLAPPFPPDESLASGTDNTDTGAEAATPAGRFCGPVAPRSTSVAGSAA